MSFYFFSEKTQSLEVSVFNDIVKATKKYFELEKEISTDLDIVLVQGITTDSIRIAFKNYFSDARDFVDYIGAELREI